MTHRFTVRVLQVAFLALGLTLLVSWARNDFNSRAFQVDAERNLLLAVHDAGPDRLPIARSRPAHHRSSNTALAARGAKRASPEVLGRIEIPRLHIRAIVAEGSDLKTLACAVGHISSTARPGESGNVALAGHRDSFFRGLGAVHADDVIRFVTPERTYTYLVDSTEVVEPTRVDVLDSTAARSLTLVTCYPFAYIGHAPKRFIVRARQLPRDYFQLAPRLAARRK